MVVMLLDVVLIIVRMVELGVVASMLIVPV